MLSWACSCSSFLSQSPAHAFVQKLWAGHDGFDQRVETVPAGRQLRTHGLDRRVVRGHQCPAKAVGQQLATEVLDKVPLPVLVDVRFQAVEALSFRPAGEEGRAVDRAAAEVLFAQFADGSV